MRIRFFEQDLAIVAAVIGLSALGGPPLFLSVLLSSSEAIEPPLQTDGGN